MVLAKVRLVELVLQDVENVHDSEMVVAMEDVAMNGLMVLAVDLHLAMVLLVKVAHPNLHRDEVEHSSHPSRKEENVEHLDEYSDCTLASSSSPLVAEALMGVQVELARQVALKKKVDLALRARVQAQLLWLHPSHHLRPQLLNQVPLVHLLVEVVLDGLSTCPA